MSLIKNPNAGEEQDERGVFWGFLPKKPLDLKKLFSKLSTTFGQPDITEELVIFFQYNGDFRIRITNTSLKFLFKSRTNGTFIARETVAKISLEEAESFIRLLSSIGYKEGLFSLGTKYTYTRNDISFVIRMNPNFGDFFQVKKVITGQELAEDVRAFLSNFLSELNLGHWSDQDYLNHITEVWKDKKHEPLLDEHSNLNKKIQGILTLYHYSTINTYFSRDESVHDILKRTSNDYSELEAAFSKIADQELVSTDIINFSNTFSIKASIIIPYYNNLNFLLKCLKSISLQNLSALQFSSIEVIVVDDGSSHAESEFILKHIILELKTKGVDVQFIRVSKNQGRGFARNLGVSVAKNDILIFIDSDIVLNNNYVKETLIRHQYLDNIVLVGFKENIIYQPNSDIDELVKKVPDIEKDFRNKVNIKKDWDGLYAVTVEGEISCLIETEYFKKFGFGKILGPYDLPCMVVTSNISVKKKYFELIGGFSNQFSTRWGYEDTFLGACLIATNNFIIPLISTGVYHLVTENEKKTGIREEKTKQLTENFQIYKKLISQKGYLKSKKIYDQI